MTPFLCKRHENVYIFAKPIGEHCESTRRRFLITVSGPLRSEKSTKINFPGYVFVITENQSKIKKNKKTK